MSPALAWHQKHDRPIFPLVRIASVVETGQLPWLTYPNRQIITRRDIPLGGLYNTLGIDRALAVWGAGNHYGWPILVIDAGTALTMSGAEATQFKGGAIAPGLGLQLKMLTEKTAALPSIQIPQNLPPRWANNTAEAMLSGVIYSILDSIITFNQHWTQEFPHSQMILTGGDGQHILNFLQQKAQQEKMSLRPLQTRYDKHLIFRGMSQLLLNSPTSR